MKARASAPRCDWLMPMDEEVSTSLLLPELRLERLAEGRQALRVGEACRTRRAGGSNGLTGPAQG